MATSSSFVKSRRHTDRPSLTEVLVDSAALAGMKLYLGGLYEVGFSWVGSLIWYMRLAIVYRGIHVVYMILRMTDSKVRDDSVHTSSSHISFVQTTSG